MYHNQGNGKQVGTLICLFFSYLSCGPKQLTSNIPLFLSVLPDAVLSFFVCFNPGDPYRAIYLESFTLQDLVTKICSKVNHVERKQIGQVVRSLINRPIEVHVDDAFVSTNIPEEQPMYIKFRLQEDSSYKMILHY
jgi:hypothetical protein